MIILSRSRRSQDRARCSTAGLGWWSLLDIIERNYFKTINQYLNNLILPLRICSMGFPLILRASVVHFNSLFRDLQRKYSFQFVFILNKYYAKNSRLWRATLLRPPSVGPKSLFVSLVFENEFRETRGKPILVRPPPTSPKILADFRGDNGPCTVKRSE